MADLDTALVRLASQHPHLRPHVEAVRKVVANTAYGKALDALEDFPNVLQGIQQEIYRQNKRLRSAETERAYTQALSQLNNLYADLFAEVRKFQKILSDLRP
jgi:hypothetical protein